MAIAAMPGPRIADREFLQDFKRAMDEAENAAVTKMQSVLIECGEASTEEITKCMENALYYFTEWSERPCGAVAAVKQVLQAIEIQNRNGQRLDPLKLFECVPKVRDAAVLRLQWVSHPIGNEGPYKDNLMLLWPNIPDDQYSYMMWSFRKKVYEPFEEVLFPGRVANIIRGGPRPQRQRPQRQRILGHGFV